jgi:fumarylacetoacetase
LAEGGEARAHAGALLHERAACRMELPAAIGDYTDFFSGIHHASNAGRIFRPGDEPLSPNYKYMPIAYHGRASSVVPSDTPIRRPHGQRRLEANAPPSFGPSARLDYECELGIWIGVGNALGTTIPIAEAWKHIAGFCLLNDWSARDLQAWEARPLGPFLSKSFATTVSPWIVTPEALAPFRLAQEARSAGDPPLPAYLWDEADQSEGALNIDMEAELLTPAMVRGGHEPYRLSRASTRHLYWTFAQMVAQHSSNGCNLRPGDLLGSGTVSAPDAGGLGSLLEITRNGKQPLRLPSGEIRTYLQDGDEVIFRAYCRREGFAPIGFGACRGVILAAGG